MNDRFVWRYEVKPEAVDAFIAAYGKGGEWDAFFSGAPGYERTEFYREVGQPNVFLTLDYWSRPGQRDAYVTSRQTDYDELDSRCANLTVNERRI